MRARRAVNGALSGALLGAVIAVVVTLLQDGGIDPVRVVVFAAVFAAIRGVRILAFPGSAGEGLLGVRRPTPDGGGRRDADPTHGADTDTGTGTGNPDADGPARP